MTTMQTRPFYFQQVLHAAYESYLREAGSAGSLRGFAKKIGLNSGNLSRVLNGEHGLHPTTAQKIIDTLSLTEAQKTQFLDSLVQFKGRRFQSSPSELLCSIEVAEAAIEDVRELVRGLEEKLRVLAQQRKNDDGRVLTVKLHAETSA